MNNIKIFENEDFGVIRTVMIDGEPWFVGKGVAKTSRRLCEDTTVWTDDIRYIADINRKKPIR